MRHWEVEQSEGYQITRIKGRLRENISFWRNVLKAPTPVLNWIEDGYKLPLITEPPAHMQANQPAAIEHQQFINEAVVDLLHNGCVQKVVAAPHVCSPLSVVCNAEGKKRLAINLRYVNHFLKRDPFKYEDLSILSPGDFMCKFHLKSGYHHVEIFEPH